MISLDWELQVHVGVMAGHWATAPATRVNRKQPKLTLCLTLMLPLSVAKCSLLVSTQVYNLFNGAVYQPPEQPVPATRASIARYFRAAWPSHDGLRCGSLAHLPSCVRASLVLGQRSTGWLVARLWQLTRLTWHTRHHMSAEHEIVGFAQVVCFDVWDAKYIKQQFNMYTYF